MLKYSSYFFVSRILKMLEFILSCCEVQESNLYILVIYTHITFNDLHTLTLTAQSSPKDLVGKMHHKHRTTVCVPHKKGQAQESKFQNLTKPIFYYVVLCIITARKLCL